MSRSENAIVTVLCMIYKDDKILLQDRVKNDWHGLTFPGGHVEKCEPFVKAVIREIKEETGLDIIAPKLCGVKQFQTDADERYIVLLFKTNQFSGNLQSSDEGEMKWVARSEIRSCPNLVDDFFDLLQVFDEEDLTEFFYERSHDSSDWTMKLY